MWWEDVAVRLRHVTTGHVLGVTSQLLPQTWAPGSVREVVGTPARGAGVASVAWRVAFSRTPRAGGSS